MPKESEALTLTVNAALRLPVGREGGAVMLTTGKLGL